MKSMNMEKCADGLMAQVVELAQKNYTKTEISKRAGVSRTTVSRWLKSVERESQKQSGEKTDALLDEALVALRQRVKGFQMVETKTTYVLGSDNLMKVKERVEVIKDVAPDLSAIIFMLTNRAPSEWRQKPEPEVNNVESDSPSPDLSALSDQTLNELLEAYAKNQK